MPWCASCERFLSPPTVTREGTCPQCGSAVEPGRSRPAGTAEPDSVPPPDGPAGDEEIPPVPLHLKVLLVSLVVYLGWRFIQGVEWVIHRF